MRSGDPAQQPVKLPAREGSRTRLRTITSDARISDLIPRIFVIICLPMCLAYALLLPPLQAPDEFAHLFRAYGISEGHLVAGALTPIPLTLQRLVGRFPPHVEQVRRISAQELLNDLDITLTPDAEVQVPNEGMNVNTWIPYVPAATVVFFARITHASPLAIMYSGRVANLLGYIFLTWLALRLLPVGRMLLFTVSLMPMVLHQAAALSWDSITFALAFFFCALVVRSAHSNCRLAKGDYMLLGGSVLVISLCKIDFALLPGLALIPAARFASRRVHVAFLVGCFGAAVFANALWQYADHANLELFKASVSTQYHTNMPDNIWYLYYNTGYFINAAVRSIISTGGLHLGELIGTFGWLYVRLSPLVVVTYLGLLLAVGLTSLSDVQLGSAQRWILFCIGLIGSCACVLAMWLQTPDFYIQNAILHNIGTLYGIQGRHFIPFVFPSLLLLSNKRLVLNSSWMLPIAISIIIAVNVNGLAAIRGAYY